MRFLFPLLALPGLVLACSSSGGYGGPAPEDNALLTGSVAYRERMALPADAVVEVRLHDVSRQDVAAPVLAEAVIRPEGRQVPLPFELRYDPGRIQPNGTYAVRATIRSAGRMLFTTDEVHQVITRGNPTEVELWLKRVAEPPAGGGGPGGPAGLEGSAWRLEDLGGAGVIDDAQATLEFPEPGKVAGRGSCNRFFGTVELSGESIRFGGLGATKMACVEAVANQESKYFEALRGAERFELDGSRLRIYSRGMDQPAQFIRIDQ